MRSLPSPFLVIKSRGDDVLIAEETLSRADWIGPSPDGKLKINNNGHDVFLSHDAPGYGNNGD
jgi:hypothetical protein